MCRAVLVRESAAGNGLTVIGDECHIVSPVPGGPRAGIPLDDLDGYENLVLLCPNDHRLIDTLVADYPRDRVLAIKRAHEDWVRTTLAASDAIALDDPSSTADSAPASRDGTGPFKRGRLGSCVFAAAAAKAGTPFWISDHGPCRGAARPERSPGCETRPATPGLSRERRQEMAEIPGVLDNAGAVVRPRVAGAGARSSSGSRPGRS